MRRQYTTQQLARLIRQANRRAYSGRLERLRFLLSNEDPRPFPAHVLAYEYYEEARLCWYVGAFVATIMMSQLTLEEMLRAHYRCGGEWLNQHKRVDKARFVDLINQAAQDGLTSSDETAALHTLRKQYRNPYVHTRMALPGRGDPSKPSALDQHVKITAPEVARLAGLERGTEDEARQSIALVASLFPKISRRMFGVT